MGRSGVFNLFDLLALPDLSLRHLPKEEVLDIYADFINFQDSVDAFGFLTNRYVQHLSPDDVNFIFKHFHPALYCGLFQENAAVAGHDIVNLLTLCLQRVAEHVVPNMQLQFKDLYSAVLPIISRSLEQATRQQQQSDVAETLRLHRVLLAFLMSRRFALRSSPAEMRLFREIIGHLLHIAEQLLYYDQSSLADCWKTIFRLTTQNDFSGSSLTALMDHIDLSTTFQYLSDFVTGSQQQICLLTYSKVQLHFTALVKLREMCIDTAKGVLRIRAKDLINAFELIDQQTRSNGDEREVCFSNLKGIVQKLIQMTSLKDTILDLAHLPNNLSFKYCLVVSDQLIEKPNSHAVELFRFITESLLTSDKLASTPKELRILIARSTTVVHSCSDNPQLFYAVMRLLVQVTLNASSYSCRAFKFSTTLQESVLRLLPQKCLISAFYFYKAVCERLPNNPATPVRWTFYRLTRTIYSLMYNKYQQQIRDQLSDQELSLFVAINREHTSALADKIISFAHRFPQNATTFKRMCSTMQIFAMSNHKPYQDQAKALYRKLKTFWLYFIQRIRIWGRFQWMGVFMHLLIRVTAKVNHDLLKIHLKPTICADMKLPQFTALQIILALLDCGKHGDAISQLAELFVRKCNVRVKGYIFYMHSVNPKNSVLERTKDHDDNQLLAGFDSTTPLPHNCCERTCCFVLANKSEAKASNHEPISCNINHAIEGLQKKRRSVGIPQVELRKIRRLAAQLNEILAEMPHK